MIWSMLVLYFSLGILFAWSSFLDGFWWTPEGASHWTVGSEGGSVISIYSETLIPPGDIWCFDGATIKCCLLERAVYLFSFGF